MIIRNTFNSNKNNFGSRRNFDDSNNYLDQQKKGLQKSIDKLDERYQNGEIDINKFKKIAGNYAEQHEDLNRRINDHRN